ncbi:MAG: cytochrome c oxidase assembly protein [Alphaproteobacteria bacterium]
MARPSFDPPSGAAGNVRPHPYRNPDTPNRRSRWLLPTVLACVMVVWSGIAQSSLGPIARHMGQHILIMNILAPFLALAIIGARQAPVAMLSSGCMLLAATAMQLGLLWVWHSPTALGLAHAAMPVHVLMQVSLLGASLWFWLAALSEPGSFQWRAIFAMLVTGKLFCLLGVLLVFAPRALYPDMAPVHAPIPGGDILDDQRLAGLMMLAACPATYVLAGVVLAARSLRRLTARDAGPAAILSLSAAER